MQNGLSLLDRSDLDGLVPWLRESGIGYLAYSPLAAGRLTGGMRPDVGFSENNWRGGAGRFADWREQESDWPFDPGPLSRADWQPSTGCGRWPSGERRRRPAGAGLGARPAGVTATIAGSRDPPPARTPLPAPCRSTTSR